MARTQGTSARTQRLIAAAATGLVAVSTAFAFGRVFVGHGSTYRLLAAGLASAALAALLERRNLLLATLVTTAGMLAAIGLLVFPDTTWHGLPSLDTLRAMADASRLVGEQARLQVAPTEPLEPLLLAGVTAIWAAIFSAHALAFRAGSPLLALLPPVALVAFADTVLEEFIKPLYGVFFLVGALAVVFADGLRRVQGWGPVWSGPGRAARLTRTAGRGARSVAVATLTLAAVAPILLPGFGSRALLDLSTPGDDRVRIDPLVSIAEDLKRNEVQEVFQVETDQRMYWRLLSLPDFDGTTWRPDTQTDPQEVESGTLLVPGEELSIDGQSSSISFVAPFSVTSDLGVPWVPVPYAPSTVQIDHDGLRWDPGSGTVTVDDPLDAGAAYTVTASLVRPSPEQLREVTFGTPAQNPRNTAYPPNLPDGIFETAQDWTRDATTVYDQVIAIQEHLTDETEFTYDEDVPARDSSYTLEDFLLRDRAGFCQQFSSAMAVMLRTLGIPARVAVGFTAGEFDNDAGVTRVTTEQAHSWVEVLFDGYGWLAFEPTPGRSIISAYPYQNPIDPTCQASPGRGCSDSGPGAQGDPSNVRGGTTPQQLPVERPVQPGSRSNAFEDAGVAPSRRFTARQLLLLGMGFAAIALLLIPPVRALRRRRRLRKAAGEPRRLILATYDVFTERAGELGFPREAGETLEEYRARVLASGRLADGHLDRLTRIASGAAYAPREPSDDDARGATEAAGTAIRQLRKSTGVVERVAGAYRRQG